VRRPPIRDFIPDAAASAARGGGVPADEAGTPGLRAEAVLADLTAARYLNAMNEHDHDHLPGGLDLRDQLALDRTRLANERTALAHARTTIMLVVTGGTLIKLFAPQPTALTSGWALVAVGLALFAVGIWRFLVRRSALRRLGRSVSTP